MKKIVILQHNEGQLANQLWLFPHLIAYSLEKRFDIDIWCFYQYTKFFNTPFPKNKLIKWLFFKTFPTFVLKNKNAFRFFRKIYRFFYKLLAIFPIKIFYSKNIVDSSQKQIILDDESKKPDIIKKFETDPNFNTIYTMNWNFFAYTYLEKYRDEIKNIFKPKKQLFFKIESYINDIRAKFDYIIGLHLRFKEPGDGDVNDPEVFWYVENKDLNYVRQLLDELFKIKNLNKAKTAVLIASNAKNLNLEPFKDLNIFYEKRNLVEDLFLLSRCDIILATKSSFSSWASYIEEKPYLIIYKNKNKFLKKMKVDKCYLWRKDLIKIL
ncbi:MAG: alpha-1,2-fucosyltransferase [Minisyncoccia bacterium]